MSCLRIIVFLLSLAGTLAPSFVIGQETVELTPLQRFAIDPFEEPVGSSMVVGNALPKIRERFGIPTEMLSTPFPDRTSDQMLTHTTLRYDGLLFNINEDADRKQSRIQRTEISGSSHALKYGLTIGSTKDDIFSVFGSEKYMEHGGQLRTSTHIWETCTDTEFRPGEEVTGEAYIEIVFDIDEMNTVTRVVLESIEL